MTPSDKRRPDKEEERASLLGLGLAVERLRCEAEMTRQAVSNRGGLASATITEIEKGQKEEPRWPTIRRLAKGLGVTTVDLILLGLELAPGAAGDRLRQQDLNLQKALAKGAGLHAHRSADPSTVGDGAESPGDGQ